MHKNKYDHNILLNDIQKLDKIQHKHSLVAIRFPDTSAEKKYLVYYDERWDCKLFLNYKTVDRADEESVINKVSADLNVDKSQINCRYISSKVQEKYSESHQENRIYNHRLYEIKIQVFPEDEQKENFVVNGRHYYWMSISDMERDPNIVKKNLDVIDFVKESMQRRQNGIRHFPALLLYQSMQEKLPVASSLYPYSRIIKILSVLTSLTNNSINTSCSDHK